MEVLDVKMEELQARARKYIVSCWLRQHVRRKRVII
jgi:hypothetical protein